MEPATIVFTSVLGTLIFLGLLRWFLAVDARISHQKAMIAFLIKLCRQQGVPDEEINATKKLFKLK